MLYTGQASEKITDVIGSCRYNAKFFYSWDMGKDEEGNPVVIKPFSCKASSTSAYVKSVCPTVRNIDQIKSNQNKSDQIRSNQIN